MANFRADRSIRELVAELAFHPFDHQNP